MIRKSTEPLSCCGQTPDRMKNRFVLDCVHLLPQTNITEINVYPIPVGEIPKKSKSTMNLLHRYLIPVEGQKTSAIEMNGHPFPAEEGVLQKTILNLLHCGYTIPVEGAIMNLLHQCSIPVEGVSIKCINVQQKTSATEILDASSPDRMTNRFLMNCVHVPHQTNTTEINVYPIPVGAIPKTNKSMMNLLHRQSIPLEGQKTSTTEINGYSFPTKEALGSLKEDDAELTTLRVFPLFDDENTWDSYSAMLALQSETGSLTDDLLSMIDDTHEPGFCRCFNCRKLLAEYNKRDKLRAYDNNNAHQYLCKVKPFEEFLWPTNPRLRVQFVDDYFETIALLSYENKKRWLNENMWMTESILHDYSNGHDFDTGAHRFEYFFDSASSEDSDDLAERPRNKPLWNELVHNTSPKRILCKKVLLFF